MNALRWAARQLARSPAFSAVAILTLGIGIGASTLIFSVLDGVLLAPLPYPQADRVVRVFQVNRFGDFDSRAPISDPNFADLKEQTRVFSAFAQFTAIAESVAGGSEPVREVVTFVSQEFYDAIGVQPLHGRTFTADELVPNGARAVIVSHRYWQRYLGGTEDFAARRLRVGGHEYSVVGVMPPGFDYPDGSQLWTPRATIPINPRRTAHNFQALGRVAPGVSLEQARTELTSVARRLKTEYGGDTWMVDAAINPIRDELVGNVRPALLVLGAAVALLFFVAWANVVSMLLARAVAREQELAVRIALGAGRLRLARQFFAETLVLCAAGGLLGVLLAVWGLEVLVALQAGSLPRADALHVDALAVAVAAGLAGLAAASLSLLLAWRAGHGNVAHGANGRGTVGGRRSKLREVLVAAQVGVALVLLVGTVLLGRSFARLVDVDPGFRTGGAMLMHLALPRPDAGVDPAPLARFYEELMERLRALPGVELVAGVTLPPLTGERTSNGTVLTLNRPDEVRSFDEFTELAKDPARAGLAEFRLASDDYFAALDIPLLRGRLFERGDAPGAEHVAVLSRSLAESKFPGEDPLGKLLQFGNMDGDLTPFRVVGVVGDVHEFGVDVAPRPTFYGYYRQRPRVLSTFWTVIRAPNAETLVPEARRIVQSMNPDLAPQFRSAEDMFARSIAQRRFNLTLLAVLGTSALLLALAGIYGAIAFHVAQRAREIGVRMALGAVGRNVVALIVRRSLFVAAVGIAGGLAIALGASRLIGSLLYAVSPYDPVAYAGAAFVLLAAAAVASWLPATRAARVDPITALRSE